MTNEQQDEKLKRLATHLAERLRSPDGAASMVRAANETRQRSEQISEAARFDPDVLQKRVTY